MTELDAVRGAAPGAFADEEGAAGPAAGARAAPVTVVQFPPVWGRNVSPFSLKLETWLTLADIPYEVQASRSFSKAPKGKLPYIVDGGRLIGDTTLIIEHLKATRGIDPDAGLGPRERAEATALQRLLEEHLYFATVYSRFVDDEGWEPFSEALLGEVPRPVRGLARTLLRERVRRMLHAQGIGRHARHEVYALARTDLEAVAELLGDKPFFMGDRITTIDAAAYGVLACILLVPLETELKRIALEQPGLRAWCEAMEQGLRGEGG